jgi:predicted RNA binding protein YcfA (HicA-like mRNA interferase family)
MVAALKRAGFSARGQEGSHVMMEKPGLARPVVVPQWDELPPFVVSKCLSTAGIGRKRYLELLGKRKSGRN